MAYNPNLYMPYGQQSYPQPTYQQTFVPQMPQMPQMAQPQQQTLSGNLVIKVYGRHGAESLPLGPNTVVAALDRDNGILYYVQTDDASAKDITEFDLVPRNAVAVEKHEYVTRDDFDELAKRVEELAPKSSTRTRKAATDGE